MGAGKVVLAPQDFKMRSLSRLLVVTALFASGCLKEMVIRQKTESAYKNAKPLTSKTPLPKDTPPPAPGAFPHEIWDGVLSAFVDERGYVDYQRLAKERGELDRYAA